jgi:DNA-directed RNA polymerase subunit RPC12/RpoP
MPNEAIRGNSLRSSSLVSDIGVELEGRQVVEYRCSHCVAVLAIPFAIEAESPAQWPCSRCGHEAWKDGAEHVSLTPEKVGKTPFEMLLERRSRDDLEEILTERLIYLRSRRGLDAEAFASSGTSKTR